MTSSAKIRIVCIDDHPIVREGLASIIALQSDMEMAGAAESGAQALALFRRLKPDIALVDLRLPDISGHELTRQILEQSPEARTIVLTSFEGDADIERALAAGAKGYVVKGMLREELLGASAPCMQESGTFTNPAEAGRSSRLGEAHRARGARAEGNRDGKRNKEIGAELSIAEDTVKMHVKNI